MRKGIAVGENACQGRKKKNDVIPENADFLRSYGLHLRGNQLVLNEREPLDPPAGGAVDWCDMAVQFSHGVAGLPVLKEKLMAHSWL